MKKKLLLSVILVLHFLIPKIISSPLCSRLPIKNYLKNDLIICSFGASVTVQKNSIWDNFVNDLNKRTKRNHKHMKIGYGGEHLYSSAICHISEVMKYKPDICILDWFDTAYIDTTEITEKCIETIIRKLYEMGTYIIFYYHIRSDIDNKRREFFSYIDSIGSKYNATSYYEEEAFYALKQSPDLKNILRDCVHTTSYGSQFLGNLFCNYFFQIPVTDGINDLLLPQKNYFYDVEKVKITANMIRGSFWVDSEGFFVIDKSSSLMIELQGKLLGLVMKIGPYSPIVTITTDNRLEYEYSVWDPWCYYERKTDKILIISTYSSNIQITINEKSPNYQLVRREFDYAGIQKLLKFKEYFRCP